MAGYQDIANSLLSKFGTGQIQKNQEDKDMAKIVMDQFERAKSAKQETKVKWIEHVKLWRGDHWKKGRAKWKSTTVENIVFSIIETMVPLMVDRTPEMVYIPQTAEDEELSYKMNQVSSFIWTVDDMDEKMPTVLRDILILGTGCMKVRWEDTKLGGMGEVTTDVLDPFNVYPDPEATDPSNMRWVIVKDKMSVKEIKSKYGKDVPSDKAYNDDDNTRPTDTLSMQNSTNYSNVNATILEKWYLDENRKMRTCVVSNGVLLEDRETPYETNDFPILFFFDHKLNGEFWGIGEIENLKPLQYEVNKVRAMIMDNMIATNNTMIVVDSTAGVKMKDLRNEPGLLIEKQPGGSIVRLPAPPLPNYIQNQIEINRMAMQNVSGVTDITKGIANGQTSGSTVQMLTEAAQTRIRGKLKNVEATMKKLGRWYLTLVRQFYQEPRIISLVDGNDGIKFTQFNGKDLRPQIPKTDPMTGQPMLQLDEQGQPVMNPATGQPMLQMEEGFTTFTVKISSGSSMMLNKSAKYQQTLELYQNGAVDIESLLKAADIGDSQDIIRRLIHYGKLPDPNTPKVDVGKILADLGFKVNISGNNPDVIMEMMNQMKQQADTMNQTQVQNAQTAKTSVDQMNQDQVKQEAQQQTAQAQLMASMHQQGAPMQQGPHVVAPSLPAFSVQQAMNQAAHQAAINKN